MSAISFIDKDGLQRFFTGIKTLISNKYEKPSGGIPKADLTSGVQASLDKADSALQTHQDLSAYVEATDLATIATTGDYTDLTNTPTIPSNLSDLSDDSTHRVVTDTEKTTWSGKQDALTFDTVPTQNSNNPITSGGVYDALGSSGGGAVSSVNGQTGAVVLSASDVGALASTTKLADLTDDTTHRTVTDTEKTAWDAKQSALTFDNAPTSNSSNPVTSDGISSAISGISSAISMLRTSISNMLGVVIDGNKTPLGASTGQYVILLNSSITGKTDGLYKAAKTISANTAIDGTYLTAVSNLGEQIRNLEKNTLGTEVDVSGYNLALSNTKYTFPSDGYVNIYSGTASGTGLTLYLYSSSSEVQLSTQVLNSNSVTSRQLIFVKKGMRMILQNYNTPSSHWAKFRPLV